MGFFPITGLSGKTGGSYLVPSEPEFRLDLLTPLHGGGDEPFEHPQLHVAPQPLLYMEFALRGVEQAVLFSAEGAVLVSVLDPGRFALHKLWVHGERSSAFRVKSTQILRNRRRCSSCYSRIAPRRSTKRWRICPGARTDGVRASHRALEGHDGRVPTPGAIRSYPFAAGVPFADDPTP
jgi:hypothetical protein